MTFRNKPRTIMKKLYISTLKINLFFKHLLTIISFALILIGCQKEDFTPDEVTSNEIQENLPFKEGQTILGKKLENPYSIENMQKAFDNLTSENKLKSAIKIEPTHYYVRFRPKSEQELETILRDTTLTFYSYPLDVEIKRGGTHFHDPSIPEKEITWQYTVVPVNYVFPKIQHQILAKLFLLEEDGELQKLKSANIDYFDWLQLEEEALRITGNLPEKTIQGNVLKSSSWRPAGTIKVRDDYLSYSQTSTRAVFDHWEYYDCSGGGLEPAMLKISEEPILKSANIIAPIDYEPGEEPTEPTEPEICRRAIYRNETVTTSSSHLIPLVGVEVRARRWFTTHKGYVNSQGRFVCDGTFIYDANYSIEWERYDFDIRDGSYGQAYFNGPKQTGDWNLDIEKASTPKSFLFAHIFRGAYTYYYNHNNWGILSPPERDGLFQLLQQRLHIAGKDTDGQAHYFDFNALWQAATVVVYAQGKYTNGTVFDNDSREIFGTTIHELTHASHWYNFGYTDINWLLNKRITESWAVGVSAVITNDIYSTNDYEIKQTETIAQMSDGYTSIVWDMIDDFPQHAGDPAYPDDQVSGYTLSQIENALPGNLGSWWTWRDRIKAQYTNPTEEHLDKLFQNLK
jgi:hypothetical protein